MGGVPLDDCALAIPLCKSALDVLARPALHHRLSLDSHSPLTAGLPPSTSAHGQHSVTLHKARLAMWADQHYLLDIADTQLFTLKNQGLQKNTWSTHLHFRVKHDLKYRTIPSLPPPHHGFTAISVKWRGVLLLLDMLRKPASCSTAGRSSATYSRSQGSVDLNAAKAIGLAKMRWKPSEAGSISCMGRVHSWQRAL